jgi:hypothetical protein
MGSKSEFLGHSYSRIIFRVLFSRLPHLAGKEARLARPPGLRILGLKARLANMNARPTSVVSQERTGLLTVHKVVIRSHFGM